ncbi:HEAT repeat domain-containing protein [Pseudenhygromyxa sp. WMMC2535]|uniref:HEAT repeat domain-containing protein n=1 Tax=Pseudenhygromyxa sp. WMMC2535 TaxID=2712867 RepID=UPI0015559A3C|nr:HEAT repeat domain-containing protein [Pseudenhygromyxa sp. WMMC2535]NVB41371.1 HEAT repeat domain-containing protein [Pseudenhygromyxa sp. WMMC2535]
MGTKKFGTHLEHLWAVAGSRSGRLVAVAGERDAESITTSKVHIYSKSKLDCLASFAVEGAIAALDFAAEDLLVAGGDAGRLYAFVVGKGDDAKPSFEHAHGVGVAITAIASDEAGSRLAVVDDSGHLAVYELEGAGLRELARKRLSPRALRCVRFDASSGKLAAGGDDGVVRVLDGAELDAEPREMPTGEKGITALEFTGDGRVIAGCGDGSIRVSYLEGAADEEDRSRDEAHTGPVSGLVLGLQLSDEAGRELTRRLISVGHDGLLKAWIHDTRRKPRTLELGKITIRAMAWLRPYRAKDDAKGGTLLLVDDKRKLWLVKLDAESAPSEDYDRVPSHFAKLAEDLKARKDELRSAAVEALREIPEDSARSLLDRVIRKDRKPELRKLACEAVAAGARRRSRPALREAVDDKEKVVRFAALAALRSIEGEKALAPVRVALASKHADLRRHAVEQLPSLRAVSPLVPGLVADRLRDGDAKVREAALEALCSLEPKGSQVPLRTAYEHGPADVRVAALLRRFALIQGKVEGPGDPTGRDLLEDALDDEHEEVREVAFLLSIGAHPKLLGKLHDSFKAEVERLAKLGCQLVPSGGEPSEGELEPLFAAMACRYPDTALRGAKSLAVLGDSRATGALLQLSRERDAKVRKLVVEAISTGILAMPEDDRLAARLQWLLDDADGSVRAAVFEALEILASERGDAGALDLAELALGAASEDMRVRALQVLVEFGGAGKRSGDEQLARRADRLLGDALDDEATKVRGEAFRTLWAWHAKQPQTPLTRGARSRHADIRTKVVAELDRVADAWADELLLGLVPDQDAGVGQAAFEALTKSKGNKDRVARYKPRGEVYLAAMGSPRPAVRALGAAGARRAPKDEVRKRLIELLEDEHSAVHTAAIESIDRLLPKDQHAWATALGSKFYALRVRAAELCGKRRDDQALSTMRTLLSVPEHDVTRPSAELRQRACRAMADVGDRGTIGFFVELLDDGDPLVREHASRGLATACDGRDTQILLAALSHADLAVRSWIAEGLARLGDERAVPVLVGTLAHDHRPIRLGAILSLAALGAEGSRGLLRGLEDSDREILDLVFAIVVARDVVRARRGLAPDLMLAALAASQPETRFVAARALEERGDGEQLLAFATELVGPPKPDRAAELKKWPEEDERASRLRVVVEALASDDPSLRYAAARVLSLRTQPLAFWREAGRLTGPKQEGEATVPQTNWEDERPQSRRAGWIRRIVGTARDIAAEAARAASDKVTPLRPDGGAEQGEAAGGEAGESAAPELAEINRLVFGTYAGLVRQAPAAGASDETHRVRRDSIERLGKLAVTEEVGLDSALPVLRRALSDPHHLVRRAAAAALRGLYGEGAVSPLALCLQSSAADVGRSAIDELITLAKSGGEQAEAARAMALLGVDAPNAEVRSYALMQIQKLFEADSLEPWFVALESQHADLRLSVVDRLVDARDERVSAALLRAMESDHEDLRLKAASALARRGDLRTLDVLAGFLRAEDARVVNRAVEALVSLANVRRVDEEGVGHDLPAARRAAAEAITARLEDDPDRTADRGALIGALKRVGALEGAPVLLGFATGDDAGLRTRAFDALVAIAQDRGQAAQVLANGVRRARYHEQALLGWLEQIVAGTDAGLRERVAGILRDVDDAGAEALLARLLEDREESVRVAACEVLAFRAEHVEGATLDALLATLEAGRRELVLPAAEGMAARGKREAFQPLLLVLKAGFDQERRRAIQALGRLGDRRALADLELLLDPEAELSDEDRALAPAAVEALGALIPKLEDPDERDRVRETVERAAIQGSQSLRQGALAGLRAAGDARSRGLLEKIAGERLEPEAVRRAAIEQLGELGERSSEAVFAGLLSDRDMSLANAAYKALERTLAGERTRVALLALRSKHSAISGPAAAFLATHGDPEILVARMTEVSQDAVREQLRRGLIRRGECPASLAALLTGEAAAQRADAAWIAGAAGEQAKAAVGEALSSAVASSAEQWRAASAAGEREAEAYAREAWRACLWAAAQVGVDADADARAVVEGESPPLEVLAAAIRYLGRRGGPEDVARIEPALSHRDAGIRVAAGSAVAKLVGGGAGAVVDRLSVADQVAVAPLVEAALEAGAGESLLDTPERRRLSLSVFLGDARFETLITVAEAAGKDPKRLTAIASLGRLGSERATAALQAILDREGEDEAVRKVAFKALRRAQRGKTTTATQRGAQS